MRGGFEGDQSEDLWYVRKGLVKFLEKPKYIFCLLSAVTCIKFGR